MTEIPEHLLQRSRERRAALGLGGDDAGGGAPSTPASDASSTDVTPAASAAATPAPAPVEPEPKEPEPVPHYVEASQRRHRIPIWAMPVLAGLIFWAPIYVGTLETAAVGGPVEAGGDLYPTNCGGCHGPAGGGGVGRPLSGGEVLLTFPAWEDHYSFVVIGNTDLAEGAPYGDPDRPGGPHLSGEFSGTRMPGFAESLSTLEILEIVLYERVTHGEADMESEDIVALLEAIEAVEGGEEVEIRATGSEVDTDNEPSAGEPADLTEGDH